MYNNVKNNQLATTTTETKTATKATKKFQKKSRDVDDGKNNSNNNSFGKKVQNVFIHLSFEAMNEFLQNNTTFVILIIPSWKKKALAPVL